MTVAIATFGDEEIWPALAERRPIASCERLGYPYVYVHGDSLHGARNAALDEVDTEWVIHLDGDDELTNGYVEAMFTGSADVRAPAVQYVRGNRMTQPKVPKAPWHMHDVCEGACLAGPDPSFPASNGGNWVVVGAMVRTELARKVRWRDWPVYEDYDFWLRCHLAGATFEAVPAAVYMAYSRRGGRNTSLPLPERNEVHRRICRANGVEVPGR